MNIVECKRLAIINKRLLLSNSKLRIDAKNLNELKEIKELNQRRHYKEQLKIYSVEAKRI